MAAALFTAACSDSSLAPHTESTVAPHLIGQTSVRTGDTVTTRFTIDPKNSSTFNVGSSHTLYIPAKAVCDPKISSYGPGTWEQPCTPLVGKLEITAKTWTRADGTPAVDFSPSLRFMPAASGFVVTLTMKLTGTTVAPDSSARFLYCATPTSPCLDESLTDATLITQVDSKRGTAARRIKHFSGYNVSSGRSEMASSDAL